MEVSPYKCQWFVNSDQLPLDYYVSEDVKRDDLVYSAFTAAAMSIAQMVCYCAQLIGAREVIFCGNLFSSQIMKKMILEERLWNEIYTQVLFVTITVYIAARCLGITI